MSGVSNEMMFYGGIILTAVSAAGLIIYLLLYRLRKLRLDIQLDQEYGKSGEK